MSNYTSHPQGTFCWMDMGTTDVAAAKEFYGKLFGWSFIEFPMSENEMYTMFQKNGKSVAAIFPQQKAMRDMGAPPTWNNYIAVNNVDEMAKKAESLGATIAMPPMDVFDSGRMVFLQDPAGAFVALWQAKNHIGSELKYEEGALCWNELSANDTAKAQSFYSSLLGWTAADMPGSQMPYTIFSLDGNGQAGMTKIDPAWGEVPPNWLPYISVENTNNTSETVKQLGGAVLMGPFPVPTVGVFAVLRDPQGGVFAVVDQNK